MNLSLSITRNGELTIIFGKPKDKFRKLGFIFASGLIYKNRISKPGTFIKLLWKNKQKEFWIY